MPRFSIIVPVYKTEEYLRQCVDSVRKQTFSDFELILVEDGSPDGSGAICDEYARKDSRVRVIHKENGGLVSARKAGALACSGEYVLNLDSDDYIHPGLLERVDGVLRESGAQAVLFGIQCFEQEHPGEQLKCALEPGLYNAEKMQTLRASLIGDDRGEMAVLYSLCAAAVPRAAYVQCQLQVPENISRGEDLAVTAPLLHRCERVYVLDFCGYYYRQNPTSIMHTFQRDEMERLMLLAQYLEGRLGKEYENRLDVLVRQSYFDFLDRAMLHGRDTYREMVRLTQDAALQQRVRRAKCRCCLKRRVVYFLLRHRWYGLLWLLRKIKPR